MDLARFALRNDKVIVFVVAVLAVLGVRAYLQTPQSIFPDMSFSKVDVVADAGELPPDRVRVAVMKPLEAAIEALPSVTEVDGTASQGSAELLVTFAPSTNPQVDQQLVSAALAQLRASLPDVTNVVAEIVNPNNEPILSYALSSRALSTAVLGQIATQRIAPELFGAPGLGRVTIGGAPSAEYHVTLDPAALATYGISAGDVTRALQNANAVQAVGTAVRGAQQYAIVVDASLRGVATLGAVTVTGKNGVTVPISSLGTVTLGVAPERAIASFDGAHVVALNVFPLAGADTVKMAAAVEARLAALRPHLPRDVALVPFWNQTTLVVASQSALRDAILLGALIAIVVIYVFLRDLRLTAIAAAIIPVAMAIAIFALQLAGQTLNLMSVGGLAVAVGLIIDDAIVVIENIERTLRARPGAGIDESVRGAMAQLSRPMIASTAATVVVFLPLALLTGVTGYFFRALAFTLAASLIVSLALALLVAPNVARLLFAGHTGAERRPNFVDRLLDRYEPLLRRSLAHRGALFVAAGATLAVTAFLLSRLPSNFLPALDEGQFEIAYAMPTGLSLSATDAASTEMEKIVMREPGVRSVGRLTALDSNGYSPTTQNKGLLRVSLVPPGERAGYSAISDDLRNALQAAVPAATFDFHQILEDLIDGLSGTPAPIEIAVRAADRATLIRAATTIAARIGNVRGVVDAASGVVYDSPTVRVDPSGARLAALGVSASDLGDAIAAGEEGTVATQIGAAGTSYPVRVRLDRRRTLARLDDAALYAKGSATSLAALAGITTVRRTSDENDRNGQRIVRVTANVENANLSDVIAGIRSSLATVKLPPGVTFEIGGQYAIQQASFAEFLTVIGIAVVLVFAVMLATFRSFRLPLVILTAVPLALIGVATALAITNTPLNVSSFMGILLLVGIVVKNGILLIDVANERRAAGDDLTSALVAAGRTRLRPIVMTTLAAIGGLVPLAVGLGQGSEMEKPLAIAVIGGLSTATVFTLVVIPVLYAAFAGGSRAAPAPALAVLTAALLVARFVVPAVAATDSAPAAVATMRPIAAMGGIGETIALPSGFAAARDPRAALTFAGYSVEDAELAAAQASPDLAVAAARVRESAAALAIAKHAGIPSFQTTYVQAPQGNPPASNVISRLATFGLAFNVTDLFANDASVRAAAAGVASAHADAEAAARIERIKTIGLYFDALKARALASASDDALSLARRQEAAAELRFRAGDAPRLDIVRATVGVARAEADDEATDAVDANATDAIRIETGADLARFERVALAPPGPLTVETDPTRAVAQALASRPEIASARSVVAAARAQRRAAVLGRLPALSVTPGETIGTDSGVPVGAPSLSAQLTIPLGGFGSAASDGDGARVDEAAARLDAERRTVSLEVASSVRTLAAAERAASATNRASASARDALLATELGYRGGASSSLDVALAQATYRTAIVDDYAARLDLAKAEAVLSVQVGG